MYTKSACCHLFVVVGIGHLRDPNSYDGWSFYTPGRATQATQVEGSRSDKVAAQVLFSLYFPFLLPFTFLFVLLFYFSYSSSLVLSPFRGGGDWVHQRPE